MDGTLDILAQWEAFLEKRPLFMQCRELRFTWASSPDSGMYEAINKGFRFLSPPENGLMAWCNTDDVYAPGTFSSVAHAFAHNPGLRWLCGQSLGLTCGALHSCRSTHNPYPHYLVSNYCCDGTAWAYIPQGTTFWKGDLWRDAGELNTNLRFAGDFELWPRFAAHAEMAHLNMPLSVFMFRDNQLSVQLSGDGQPSFYKQEEELLRPVLERNTTIRRFWLKRVLPPFALSLVYKKQKYTLLYRRAWPQWGIPFHKYIARRLEYFCKLACTKICANIRRIVYSWVC